MKKQIDYRGYTFLMEVELNAIVERRPNGGRRHTINVLCIDMGSSYRVKVDAEDSQLVQTIKDCEKDLRDWVDAELEGNHLVPDKRLTDLGFV